MWTGLGALVSVLILDGCGTVDLGERTLPRWLQVPDAQRFGTEIHPLLFASCATAGCHRREGSFRLHAADTLQEPVGHPSELPEPLRKDYYTVLAFCNLDVEERSPLLVWGCGEEPAHPGKKALSNDGRTDVIDWLEGNP